MAASQIPEIVWVRLTAARDALTAAEAALRERTEKHPDYERAWRKLREVSALIIALDDI